MTCNMTWDTWNTSAFLLHSSQWQGWSCKCLTCTGDPARSWSSRGVVSFPTTVGANGATQREGKSEAGYPLLTRCRDFQSAQPWCCLLPVEVGSYLIQNLTSPLSRR